MYEQLMEQMKAAGAHAVGMIPVADIPFDPELRKMCESNRCGNYGGSWTCPPDLGPVDECIARAKSYQWAMVYQTVSTLEDSFDYEGMREGGKRHKRITGAVAKLVREAVPGDILQLSAGGCPICEVCARKTDEPCRHPDQKLASLEAYGVYVSQLAETAGMKYINGVNTITYFGAFLFH